MGSRCSDERRLNANRREFWVIQGGRRQPKKNCIRHAWTNGRNTDWDLHRYVTKKVEESMCDEGCMCERVNEDPDGSKNAGLWGGAGIREGWRGNFWRNPWQSEWVQEYQRWWWGLYDRCFRIHLSVRDTLSFNNMKGKAIRCMVETYSIDIHDLNDLDKKVINLIKTVSETGRCLKVQYLKDKIRRMFVSVCADYDWCQQRTPGAVGGELRDLSCPAARRMWSR